MVKLKSSQQVPGSAKQSLHISKLRRLYMNFVILICAMSAMVVLRDKNVIFALLIKFSDSHYFTLYGTVLRKGKIG